MFYYIQNWSIAISATWTEQIVVIRFAVRVAVALEEVARAQLLGAVGAHEVLRVPGLAERGDDLADDGLLAGAAASLLGCVDSLAAHVCLQITKHRIQRVLFDDCRAGRVCC